MVYTVYALLTIVCVQITQAMTYTKQVVDLSQHGEQFVLKKTSLGSLQQTQGTHYQSTQGPVFEARHHVRLQTKQNVGLYSLRGHRFIDRGIPIIKLRRSDRLSLQIGIPISEWRLILVNRGPINTRRHAGNAAKSGGERRQAGMYVWWPLRKRSTYSKCKDTFIRIILFTIDDSNVRSDG